MNIQTEIQFNFAFNQMILANRSGNQSAESHHLCICLKFYMKLCCHCSPEQIAAADVKLDSVFVSGGSL